MSLNFEQYASDLNENGFVVIPLLSEEELRRLRQAFVGTLNTLPEYNHTEEVKREF